MKIKNNDKFYNQTESFSINIRLYFKSLQKVIQCLM